MELEKLQTADYYDRSRKFKEHFEGNVATQDNIKGYTQKLDSLTASLSVSGLEDVRGDAFKEWLCYIGMCKLQTSLKDIDGNTLIMLNAEHLIEYNVTFADAAALLLRAYITHHKLSDGNAFAPPSDSILSWDDKQTAKWIESLGAPYGCLSDVGWHGAALCSLSPPRVVEASEGRLTMHDAVKFIGLVRAKRSEVDGEKATWVSKWSGASTVDSQAA